MDTACSDSDNDGCDDCAVTGGWTPANDSLDTDSDGICNIGDPDDDGDEFSDIEEFDCGSDSLDDASLPQTRISTGSTTPSTLLDVDGDGIGNGGNGNVGCITSLLLDPDDGDTSICGDSDVDLCDDCAVQNYWTPADDGPDFDGDGLCNIETRTTTTTAGRRTRPSAGGSRP